MSGLTDSKGRLVCDVEVEGRGVDAFITKASYDDDLEPSQVPDEELDYLNDTYPEYIAECAFENAIGAAERFYEGDR